MSHLDKFTVSTLPVQTMDGQPLQASYVLTRASVSPVFVVGRDKYGRNIEETRPTVYSEPWVHPCGAINHVPMRTGSVFSMMPEAKAYQDETMTELLREGWIPLRSCPFTDDYRTITGTRALVANPDNIPDCGGKPDGCEHLLALAKERTVQFAARAKADEEDFMKMKPEAAQNLLAQLSAAIGVVQDASEEETVQRPRPRSK